MWTHPLFLCFIETPSWKSRVSRVAGGGPCSVGYKTLTGGGWKCSSRERVLCRFRLCSPNDRFSSSCTLTDLCMRSWWASAHWRRKDCAGMISPWNTVLSSFCQCKSLCWTPGLLPFYVAATDDHGRQPIWPVLCLFPQLCFSPRLHQDGFIDCIWQI